MTAFDFVLLLIIAETTQQALLGDDFSLTNALLLILTLFALDVGLSYLKGWSPRRGQVGRRPANSPDQPRSTRPAGAARARVAMEDILDAAREQHGLERLDQIKFAVLEVGGHISIIPATQGPGTD